MQPLCMVVVKIVLIKESPCFNTAERHRAARWILFPVFNAFHHSFLDHLENSEQRVTQGNN